MRDHYVGDITGLLKFSLLRVLQREHRRLGIGWYYTSGVDNEKDGRHTEWTEQEHWRQFSPEIHEWLRPIAKSDRRVEALCDSVFWQTDIFFSDPIGKSGKRRSWSQDLCLKMQDADLVFLDPDNGVGNNPSKHAFLAEVQALRRPGRTLVVIGFPNRGKPHKEQASDLRAKLDLSDGRNSIAILNITVSVPTKKEGTCVPRQRWFAIVDYNEQVLQQVRDFVGSLNQLPRVKAHLDLLPSVAKYEYLVIYEQGKDGGWGAYAPDLPGLGVAAETKDEVAVLIREGIVLHLAGLRKDGLPIPEPITTAERIAVAA